MIKSKILKKYKDINHGFFNRIGGNSTGIYKSLNCGLSSQDKRQNVQKNLDIVCKKIGCKKNHLIVLNQLHSSKVFYLNKNRKKKIKGDGLITNKNGIPAYRHTVLSSSNNDLLHKKLEDLLDIGIYECEKYYPSFQQVLFEDISPQEALKFSSFEVIGRA